MNYDRATTPSGTARWQKFVTQARRLRLEDHKPRARRRSSRRSDSGKTTLTSLRARRARLTLSHGPVSELQTLVRASGQAAAQFESRSRLFVELAAGEIHHPHDPYSGARQKQVVLFAQPDLRVHFIPPIH